MTVNFSHMNCDVDDDAKNDDDSLFVFASIAIAHMTSCLCVPKLLQLNSVRTAQETKEITNGIYHLLEFQSLIKANNNVVILLKSMCAIVVRPCQHSDHCLGIKCNYLYFVCYFIIGAFHRSTYKSIDMQCI